MFEGKKVIDITRTIQSGMTVWPGDDPVVIKQVHSIQEGYLVNVTQAVMGVHAGTHMDAPLHFIDGARDIASIAIDRLMGKVLVVASEEWDIDESILLDKDLSGIKAVFFKTTSSNTDTFTPFLDRYPAITAGCAAYLVDKGIWTIGIDYLSIEYATGGQFPVHNTLLSHEVVIIENLCLRDVDPGIYDFVCLPLKITGSDGSPVRALLFAD